MTLDIHFFNIQGNILGGFNKDFQTFLFLQFSDAVAGRDWVGAMTDRITTSDEVILFKKDMATSPDATATWTNLAFSFSGLQALGVDSGELAAFPPEFAQGMAASAGFIGDAGPSAPAQWLPPLGTPAVHSVLIVAADSEYDLSAKVSQYEGEIFVVPSIQIVFKQEGRARADQLGHEHFGFKDGVSQPGIRGVNEPDDPANPDQGHPGQDLLWPGEFVLGYPTQDRTPPAGGPGFNPAPGPDSPATPPWTADGSFLVWRRLAQNVAGFRDFVTNNTPPGVSEALFGAKLVGRWASGAPLEPLKGDPVTNPDPAADPGDPDTGGNPALANDDALNNKFEFGDDADGARVPRPSHIRKVYPRDEPTPGGGESDTQTHRILRRGIAYGLSLDVDPTTDDRGLVFLCYQRSLKDQFMFLQKRWINNANFPQAGDGEDPIIAQEAATRSFSCPINGGPASFKLPQWVTTTGGEYFFQPSIEALLHIATRS